MERYDARNGDCVLCEGDGKEGGGKGIDHVTETVKAVLIDTPVYRSLRLDFCHLE